MQLDERHVLDYMASHIKGLIELIKSGGPSERLDLIAYFLTMALIEARGEASYKERESIEHKLMRD